MGIVSTISEILRLILTLANICVLLYCFYKFLGKPHDSLESRVSVLEVKQKENEQSLHQGNDRFREHGRTIEMLIRATLALLEFEVHYCETEQKPISQNLEKAKNDLNDYFAKIHSD